MELEAECGDITESWNSTFSCDVMCDTLFICLHILYLWVTNLADESKGLPPHPLGTVAEPDGELVDEVQAQVIGPTGIQFLENLHHLRAHEEITRLKWFLKRSDMKCTNMPQEKEKEHCVEGG